MRCALDKYANNWGPSPEEIVAARREYEWAADARRGAGVRRAPVACEDGSGEMMMSSAVFVVTRDASVWGPIIFSGSQTSHGTMNFSFDQTPPEHHGGEVWSIVLHRDSIFADYGDCSVSPNGCDMSEVSEHVHVVMFKRGGHVFSREIVGYSTTTIRHESRPPTERSENRVVRVSRPGIIVGDRLWAW
jgi:hypothetical protein